MGFMVHLHMDVLCDVLCNVKFHSTYKDCTTPLNDRNLPPTL